MRRYYRAKRDLNEPAIVRSIRQIPGWKWTPLPPSAANGDGFLRAGWWPQGLVLHIEVKNPEGRNRLQDGQRDLLDGGQIVVVRSFDDVETAMDRASRALGRAKHFARFSDAAPE